MKLAAGFFGAGMAFLISGLLAGAFPALWSSYRLLQLLYSLGIFRDDVAFAGNFPDPLASAVGRVFLLLSLVSFALAALSYLLKRTP
ncbi:MULTISPECIES: hypothetical protein [Deinococcus]|uniref:Uncharacterized protein n=1 Tax=Deinococcus radiodurans (strain ATCC 13939 / DSM 20539 / JCM 16871 / CCUG 27074 / LMG 4051 / NBRC 15346 / NCIMB 9279 / VKM B-1422 / R1) TaxID=243230 RepID=Q9RXE4_DEIRA|nr:hypothetical protein [Deinococcus radiodurans]AAF09956.1 hypothetical protein DR_0369 [Deinococcus radiodurans R1 = ATCC 13939 = DSM 20539]ANC72376.1 hypothetical protein A2G07_11690 [Deinococcus radiodurans R1 = ATCC 13939 = DSM 20539]QEM72324.1 hypothetical protein DXG80_11500 [Deinococcus radiodurans]QIP28561.1 hypothetical protein HAV23_04730 [Deinococcus radiodurans]QIP32726.1 hypothetical protein HAV35_12100 [Deinococcus radiodurans]